MFKLWQNKKEDNNKSKFTYNVSIEGADHQVSFDVYRYANLLIAKIHDLKNELNEIKPIVEDKKLKPAISKDCAYCKFVVRSRSDNSVIGCCKDNVCEDFRR